MVATSALRADHNVVLALCPTTQVLWRSVPVTRIGARSKDTPEGIGKVAATRTISGDRFTRPTVGCPASAKDCNANITRLARACR